MKDIERLANQIESMRHEDEEAKYGAVLGTGAYAVRKPKKKDQDEFTDAAVLNK